MCGIAGFVEANRSSSAFALRDSVLRMTDAIAHRGPDGAGHWEDEKSGIALGHRRLAILDLSEAGHQPMHSQSGRFVLVFNGEIYNYLEIREELMQQDSSLRFRGHSDTEVMLAAFEAWGIEPALRKFNGMFALALWDANKRCLFLARDRMGEKPLYYANLGSTFLFGSELKALRAYPGFDPKVDRNSLAGYLRFNCVAGEGSIYEGVQKLSPGAVLEVVPGDLPSVRQYWSLRELVESALSDPFTGSEEDAVAELDELLRRSVRMRMISDVPLGAFLSGGIDSSTIVALMQAESTSSVKTFSIGFDDPRFDEAGMARKIAERLHTEHTELIVTPDEARSVIPLLPRMYDEPFGDSSQIPTFLVAQMTRKHVTVALSGDGGDELFAGYNRHVWLSEIWRHGGRYPLWARKATAKLLASVSASSWDSAFARWGKVLPGTANQRLPGEKLHKLAQVLKATDPFSMYSELLSHCTEVDGVVIGADSRGLTVEPKLEPLKLSLLEQMTYLDAVNYLPDDILVKVDRATMAVSLEGRIPFLDPAVIRFAWRIPAHMKVRHHKGKHILRQLLSRYVPTDMFERPKSGFAVPLREWLQGPLRAWAEELLDEDRLRREGFFNPSYVRRQWKQFLTGRNNLQFHIWDILMFQAWLDEASTTSSTETAFQTARPQ